MSLVQTLEEAELAFAIRHLTALELITAVESLVAANEELQGTEAVMEIVRLNRKQQTAVDRAPDLLRAYLVANPTPPENRPRSLEECGKAVLKARLERYRDSSDLPVTVCRMVSLIEDKFDYPAWLGELYNVCDWCEEDSSRENFRAVGEEAERLAKVL